MKIIVWLLKLNTNFGEWKAGQVKLGFDFSHFLWGSPLLQRGPESVILGIFFILLSCR
jgi:hypothetical protein